MAAVYITSMVITRSCPVLPATVAIAAVYASAVVGRWAALLAAGEAVDTPINQARAQSWGQLRALATPRGGRALTGPRGGRALADPRGGRAYPSAGPKS